jgi:hypothetical protein
MTSLNLLAEMQLTQEIELMHRHIYENASHWGK